MKLTKIHFKDFVYVGVHGGCYRGLDTIAYAFGLFTQFVIVMIHTHIHVYIICDYCVNTNHMFV